MKANLVLEVRDEQQLSLLLNVAREMGITVGLDTDDTQAKNDFLKASFKTIEEEWLAPENDHWDEFIAKKLAK
jgi:hypothetical protein